MRFSNKALYHWSLLTEGLLDLRLGTRALWEEGEVGGGGKAEGTQHFFQKRLRAGRGEGRHAATSRPAPGWPQAGPVAGEFFLSLRLWNCFSSQPEQGSRGQTRQQGLELEGILRTGPRRRSPWVDADGLVCVRHCPISTHLLWGPLLCHLHWPYLLLQRLQDSVLPNLKDKRKVVSQRALEAKENLVQRRVSYKMAQE